MKGLCPFHSEKTPSFSVSPSRQLYYCFGCQKGGNIIRFVMDIENLDFVEAVKFLADRAGIPLPEEKFDYVNNGEKKNKRQLIYQINKDAALYFMDQLKTCDEANYYIKNRKLTAETVRHFALGYAPEGSKLMHFLAGKNYGMEDLIDAGLVVRNESGDVYDRFRNRLMFPIIDVRKNVIGFGGRVLGDGMPKYLNSPETEAFSKSRNLYGLNFAKKTKEEYFILVEGYMDVISLHQAGFDNAVATLGTSLTPEQTQIIKRTKSEVVIAYDSDGAGQNATKRAIEMFGDEGIKVKVLEQDEGKDPDEFIKVNGSGAFRELIKNAKVQIEFKIAKLRERYNIEESEDKLKYIGELAKEFATIKSPVEREIYVNKIAEETGVSANAILSEVSRIVQAMEKKEAIDDVKIRNNMAQKQKNEHREQTQILKAEKTVLNIIFYDENAATYVGKVIDSSYFTDKKNAQYYKLINDVYEKGGKPDTTVFMNNFPDDASFMAEMLCDDGNYADKKVAVDNCLKLIKEEYKKRSIYQLLNASSDGNLDEINQVYKNQG